MANSAMTFTYDETGTVKKVTCDWLSDDAAGTCVFSTKKISGFLLKGVTNPAGGADQPDDNYNIVLTDPEGANILGNCSDDLLLRDETNTETVDFIINGTGSAERPCVADVITISLDSCGNALQGRLVLYWCGTPH
jgi:hypothetical protein